MSLRKSVGQSALIFAFGLLAEYPAAADSLTSTSGNIVGGGINNTQVNVNGGALPARGGKYTVKASAQDSLVNANAPVVNSTTAKYVSPPAPTRENPNPTVSDHQDAEAKGTAFDAYALAKITYPAAGRWNSAGSYASVCGQGGNLPNCGNNPAGETAKAQSTVTDPWSFDVQSTAFTFDNAVTFSAGLSLQALATGQDFAESGI